MVLKKSRDTKRPTVTLPGLIQRPYDGFATSRGNSKVQRSHSACDTFHLNGDVPCRFEANVRFVLPIQPIVATHSSNFSAGE